MDSSSSSGDRIESSGGAAKRVESENVEINAVEAVPDDEAIAAEAASGDDETTAPDVSSREKNVATEVSVNEDVISMDELEATEAFFDDEPSASASNPESVESC